MHNGNIDKEVKSLNDYIVKEITEWLQKQTDEKDKEIARLKRGISLYKTRYGNQYRPSIYVCEGCKEYYVPKYGKYCRVHPGKLSHYKWVDKKVCGGCFPMDICICNPPLQD